MSWLTHCDLRGNRDASASDSDQCSNPCCCGTGVGRIILRLLEERNFPLESIKFLASGRSAGKQIAFAGQEHRSRN